MGRWVRIVRPAMISGRRVGTAVLWIALLAGAGSVAAPADRATATCGLQPPGDFSTTGLARSAYLTSAFFGTVVGRAGDGQPHHVILRVDRMVIGPRPVSPVVVNGRPPCSINRLFLGRRYLVAIGPSIPGIAQTPMPFEVEGDLWTFRYFSIRVGRPTLDGDRVPAYPAALVRFLREHIGAEERRRVAAVRRVAPRPASLPDPLRDPSRGTWAQVVSRGDGGSRLLVGDLDGSGWEALSVDGAIRISGPKHGRVLAQHADGDRSAVDLVDIGHRTVRRLSTTPRPLEQPTLLPSGDAWVWLQRRGTEGTTLWGQRLAPDSTPARLTGVLSVGPSRIAMSPDGRRVAVQSSYGWPAWVVDLVDGTLGLALLPPDSRLLPEMGRTVLRTLHQASDDPMPSFPLVAVGVIDSHTRTVARDGRTPIGTSDVLDPPTSVWQETDDGVDRLRVMPTTAGREAGTIDLPPGAGTLVVDNGIQGVDIPGWIPVFPYGLAYLPDEQGSRLAVNPRTGRAVSLPPIAIVAAEADGVATPYRRRSARPGSAPVCSPRSTTTTPLTTTSGIPSGKERGCS